MRALLINALRVDRTLHSLYALLLFGNVVEDGFDQSAAIVVTRWSVVHRLNPLRNDRFGIASFYAISIVHPGSISLSLSQMPGLDLR